MSTRIVWQSIYPEKLPPGFIPDEEKMLPPLLELFEKVARDDTELVFQSVKRSTYFAVSNYLELLNTAEVIDGVIEAEREGAAAVIIGCSNDPGLQQAREAVDIPVIGPLESSLLIATMLGHKFAVVTISKKVIPLIERQIRLYGLENRAISRRPVRSCEVPFERLAEMIVNPRDRVIPDFEKEAMECIEEGAEVIVTGCTGLGPGLTIAGYRYVGDTSVPVIDTASVAIKMAELMADLKKTLGLSTSKYCWYGLPISKELLDEYRK